MILFKQCTEKPLSIEGVQLIRDHPLALNLYRAFLFGIEEVGFAYDWVHNVKYPINAGSVSWVVANGEVQVRGSAAHQWLLPYAPLEQGFTVYGSQRFNDAAIDHGLFGAGTGNNGSGNIQIWRDDFGGGDRFAFGHYTSSWQILYATTPTLDETTLWQWGASWDGVSDKALFAQGARIATDGAASFNSVSTSGSLPILSTTDGGGKPLNGEAGFLYLWHPSPLSDNQIKDIDGNPWQIFEIRRPLFFMPGVVAVGGTVYERTLSSAVAVNDYDFRLVDYLRSLISNMDVSDFSSSDRLFTRLLSSSASIDDALMRTISRERVLFSNTNVSDSSGIALSWNKLLYSSADVNDSIEVLRDYVRLLHDDITINDSLLALSQAVVDVILRSSVDVDDAVTKVRSFYHSLFSNVDVYDSVGKASIFYRLQNDTVDVNDLLTVIQAFVQLRVLSDSITVGDNVELAKDLSRLMQSSLSVSDAVLKYADSYRKLLDTISVDDYLSAIQALIQFKLLADSIDVNDAVFTEKNLIRTLASVVTITESIMKEVNIYKLLSDSIDVTDDIVSELITVFILRVLRDTIDVSDEILRELVQAMPIVKIIMALKAENIEMDLNNNPYGVIEMRLDKL